MARRVFIVAFFLMLAAVTAVPDLRRGFGHPLGLAGLSFNYDGVVTSVTARAAASGIRVGDRIDLPRAAPDERSSYASLGTADAGQQIRMPLARGSDRYRATLTTYPESSDRIAMMWMRDAVQLFVTFLGVLVVLRRPSPATWGFFFFAFIGCSPVNDVYLLGPLWWRTIGENLYWLVGNGCVGAFGAIIFALYLLHAGPLPRWRKVVQNTTIVVACIAFAITIWHANALLFWPRPDGPAAIAYSALLTLPGFVAPIVLIATYFESSANVRERLRWIIGGFLLSAGCNVVDQMGSQGNLGIIQESYQTHSLLTAGSYIFVAVPVAYAVLKHHIIDVSVAISRATVYTALSILVVSAFALVDFFFSHALAEKSAGLIADVGLALILGFSFNTLHRRVDSFVDSFLFRKRHLAEEHVRGVADAMAYAHSETHVRSMLTSEPVRAFDLSGSRMISALQNTPEEVQTLASYVEARRAAVRLADGQWKSDALSFGQWLPAVAVPVFSHGTLDAILLYGLHQNGTDLDAEEVALLDRLGASAGAAFDRLEAEQLRRENAELRKLRPAT